MTIQQAAGFTKHSWTAMSKTFFIYMYSWDCIYHAKWLARIKSHDHIPVKYGPNSDYSPFVPENIILGDRWLGK